MARLRLATYVDNYQLRLFSVAKTIQGAGPGRPRLAFELQQNQDMRLLFVHNFSSDPESLAQKGKLTR